MTSKLDIIYSFGRDIIVKARDMTIDDDFKIIDGTSKAPSDVALHSELNDLSDKHKEVLKKLIINSIDGAINNLIWMMEQNNDKYAFVAKRENGLPFDIEQESDGLCMGQYVFIERYSKYNNILDILETGRLEKDRK